MEKINILYSKARIEIEILQNNGFSTGNIENAMDEWARWIQANPLDAVVSQPSEPTFGQWTLTTDRMPLHSGFYLTVDINENDEPFIMIYPYDEIDKTFVDMAGYPNKDVTKWMPLPKP